MSKKAKTEKILILAVILTLIGAGIVYREDFSGALGAAIVWFTVLGLAAARLVYFLIKNK
tara:strand:- start:3305 stop:3484 length:180 start_codon:yes stop_codon:yes gene_type:complete